MEEPKSAPDPELSLPERAALLAVMTFVKEASNPEIAARYGFTIESGVRKRLVELQLINASRSSARNRPYIHELTDKGWQWCRAELTKPAPGSAQKGYRLLYGVLSCLDAHLTTARLELADLFVPPPGPVDVDSRIRAAYQSLADRPGAWVSLTQLRSALADVGSGELDEALLRLDLQPRVYLIAESNQQLISDADHAAAIRIGGEDKHLLSIERA